MRASLRHGAVTALLAAVAAVLWPSPALALDIPIYANHDYQGHLARNLGTPALAHDALRLGDVAVGACVLKGTGVNVPTFICGVAGTDYQLPMTAADGSILFPTASSLRLRDVTGLSVMGRPGSSAGPAQDITATADNQVLQRLAGTVQFHTLDFSQLTGTVGSGVLAGTPYTVPYFGAGGALAENATALGYDPTNVRLGSRVSSGLPLYQLHLVDEAAAADRGIDLGEFSSTDNGPVLTLDKASGTYAAPSAVANTSAGGRVSYRQYTGTQWLETARSGVHVRPGATITSTSVPTQWYVSGSSIGNVDPYAGSGLPTGLLVEGVNAKVGYNPITPGAVGTSTGGLLSVYGQTQTTSLIAGPGIAFSNTKLMVTADAGVNNAQAAIRNTNVSATGFSQLSFSNDSGSTSAADLVFTSSTYADSYGWGPNAFAIWNAAPSGPIILGGNPGTLPVPQALRIDSDSRVSFQDSAAAVSASGFSALRSNAGHLQYSQTGGAWKSFDSFLTDPGANGVVVRTASGTTVNRSLTNTDGTIVFTFPDGVAGNPVINTAGLAPTSRTFTGTAPISFNGDHAAHTLASNMVAALDANGVTYPFLQQGVALSIPGRALNSAGNWADIVAAAGSGCVFRESGSTLGCGNITEGSVTNLAADLAGKQPTGNYITALTGAVVAAGPGSVPATVHLDAGATVQGLLPLANQAAPTGTGFDHITGGVRDSAARAVDLSTADATGTLAAARAPAYSGPVTTSAGSLATALNLNAAGISGTLQAAQEPAHTGDVTNTAGSLALTIGSHVVSDAKFRQSSPLALVGNPGGLTADVQDIVCTGAGQVFQDTGTALACQALGYASLTGTVPAVALGSFTNGSALFWNTGLAQDNSSYFYDLASHRLGLGTTTPRVALDVNGTVYAKGPVANVKAFGATGNGSTDDTASVQAALTASTNVYFPAGTYVISNVTVANDGTHIFGDGASSVLSMKTGSTGTMLDVGGNRVDIEHLAFFGGMVISQQPYPTSSANRTAIAMSMQIVSHVSHITVYGFANVGLLAKVATQDRLAHLVLTDSEFYNNYTAIDMTVSPSSTEYVRFGGLDLNSNYIGLNLSSGNFEMTGGKITDNGYGVIIGGAGNNGHGTLTSALINHNTTAIYAVGLNYGFNVTGCEIFQGDIYIKNSVGLNIFGNQLDVTNLNFEGGGINYIKHNTGPNSYGNAVHHNYSGSTDQTVMTDNWLYDGTFIDLNRSLWSDGSVAYSNASGYFTVGSNNPYSADLVPAMSSNTLPSGVASCTSTYSGTFDCWKAFDHLTGTNIGWASGPPSGSTFPQVLQYQFTSGKVVVRYSVQNTSLGNDGLHSAPNTWTFQGSNNGSTWTTLDSQSGQASWGSNEVRTFTFSNSTSYTYYRLNVASVNGSNIVQIDELQMFALNAVQYRIGAAEPSPASTLSVGGNASIGGGYSGTYAAPSNGMIVQGPVGIGTHTVAALNALDVGGAVSVGSGYAGSVSPAADGMSIQGKVAIGTSNPGAYFLAVNGAALIGSASSGTDLSIDAGGSNADWPVDVSRSRNGNAFVSMSNTSTGAAAIGGYVITENASGYGTNYATWQLQGSGYSSAGIFGANGMVMEHVSSGAFGMTFSEYGSGDVCFFTTTSRAERMCIKNNGTIEIPGLNAGGVVYADTAGALHVGGPATIPSDVMHFFVSSFNGLTTNSWLVPSMTSPMQSPASSPPETRLTFAPARVRLLVHNLSTPSTGCNVTFAISLDGTTIAATNVGVTPSTPVNTFLDSGGFPTPGTALTDSWGVGLSLQPSNATTCNWQAYVTAYFYAE